MSRVVIIGASRGIGQELAVQYAANGWQVYATVRSAEAIAALPVSARGYVADVTDEASLAAVAAKLPGDVDLLIVNAGVNVMESALADVDADQWQHVMTTNALGPLLAARALGNTVAKGGKIVALSSTLGSIAANAGGGLWSYRMSKAALNAGMKNLSIELKRRDIAVAVLHPGWVKTDMGGAGAEVAVPDSVAGLRGVIAALDMAHTGSFTDYRGNALQW
jgi:NAD(P)-dependent dehydrogenase (short-subunit alcohol dehydrogenase family)